MPSTARLLLAPGASGGVASIGAYARPLRSLGVTVTPVALPKGAAERAIPAYRAALAETAGSMAIGGQSFGGRVASLLVADGAPATVTGLVLLCYPLHAPGRNDAWDERTAHWPRLRTPVLLLSGESDPFARIDLLRSAVGRLPHHELVTYPGVGHGLGPVLDDAVARIADFVQRAAGP